MATTARTVRPSKPISPVVGWDEVPAADDEPEAAGVEDVEAVEDVDAVEEVDAVEDVEDDASDDVPADAVVPMTCTSLSRSV